MSFKKALLLFLLFFVVLVIIKLPVALIADRVTLPNGVAYEQISGTIWNGKVKRLQVNQEILHRVEWQIAPWNMLLGELTVALKFGNARDAAQISGKGVVSYSMSGLAVDDAVVRVPAKNLKKYSPLPIGNVGGRVILDVAQYRYTEALCDQLTGDLVWSKSELDFGGPITFGAISADLSCRENLIVAQFNGNNRLGLEGEAVIESVSKFSIDGFVKPDATLPRAVHDGVGMLGKPDAKGKYKLKL